MNRFVQFSGFLLANNSTLRDFFLKLDKSFRIVYYHLVSDDKKDYYFDNKISVKEFKDQIDYFKKKFKIISLEEAIRRNDYGEDLSGHLSITTDDGFVENYDIIAPILTENNITATFFLISNCIDNKDLMWRNKLIFLKNQLDNSKIRKAVKKLSLKYGIVNLDKYSDIMKWSDHEWKMSNKDKICDELWEILMPISLQNWLFENKPYLTISQIIELKKQGFSFGSHTKTHPICNKLSYSEFYSEIKESLYYIENILGNKISFFSYPFNIRAHQSIERKIIKDMDISSYLGGKNKLSNNNPLFWERDLQEAKRYEREFRFYILPYLRKYLNIITG